MLVSKTKPSPNSVQDKFGYSIHIVDKISLAFSERNYYNLIPKKGKVKKVTMEYTLAAHCTLLPPEHLPQDELAPSQLSIHN